MMEGLHVTIDESTIAGRRVFVFGDVHGCYDELVKLLARADDTAPGNILYISVGDLINRGPMSAQVVSLVRNRDILSVRGNHEENFLKNLTVMSKKMQLAQEFTEEDINFLRNLPYTITIPSSNAIIVHAGIIPGLPLAKQDPYTLTCMRNVVKNESGGYRPYSETDQGVAWASVWPGPEHVYYGHDARRGRDGIQRHEFATGLDTRCVKGGQLSGVFLDGAKEALSVPAKMTYFSG
ncbi:bis(5'-nucleosyl)-tetraphosphatase, symmetrical-like [Branchiostoma lanceolatum]|uniref:bis(5'-nucleosyl)-tetraphosphatase, symmetrical-like n=1 Tax=Branchiostoma lanceolatum TaxID=7740 RepID=UPI0034531B37